MIPVHPNCVRLFNAWEEQGKLYLWLEYCDTSLEAYAEKNHEIHEIKVWEILLDLLLVCICLFALKFFSFCCGSH